MQRSINKRMKALVGKYLTDKYATFKYLITGYVTDEADDVSILVLDPSKFLYSRDDLLANEYFRIEENGTVRQPAAVLSSSKVSLLVDILKSRGFDVEVFVDMLNFSGTTTNSLGTIFDINGNICCYEDTQSFTYDICFRDKEKGIEYDPYSGEIMYDDQNWADTENTIKELIDIDPESIMISSFLRKRYITCNQSEGS